MAPPSEIPALTEELILSITQLEKSTQAFKKLRDTTTRRLRYHSFGRTNQFEVSSRLEGLQEKFAVLDHEELADALRLRLDELSKVSTKWTPDTLAFILELSDRPASNSRVEHLEKIRPSDSPPPLTWAEILASEPLDLSDEVWQNVDFTIDSSEDESYLSSSRTLPRLQATVTLAEDVEPPIAFPEHKIHGNDDDITASLLKAQFWRSTGQQQVSITELQAVRETIFMLQGLPTSLYWRVGDEMEIDKRFILSHADSVIFRHLLHSFCELGLRLDTVRSYVKLPQTVPSMQTFRSGLEECLMRFDDFLGGLQVATLAPHGTTIVSLAQLEQDVRDRSKDLSQLVDLIGDVTKSSATPFCCLESLFEIACSNQAVGNDESFRAIATIFMRCYETYSKPMRDWIDFGTLAPTKESFFIVPTSQSSGAGGLWHHWFTLATYAQTASSRVPNAPSFLHSNVEKVLQIGKSMVFLRELGDASDNSTTVQTRSTWDKLVATEPSNILIPFAESFEVAVTCLLDAKHLNVSERLRHQLDQKCGLWRSLQALEYVYFAKDISITSRIDIAMFERIDKLNADWNDRFTIKELVLETFGHLKCVDLDHLVVRAAKGTTGNSMRSRRRSVEVLKDLVLDYSQTWPLQNILSQESMMVYRRLSTFLLQIRRARYVLERTHILHERRTNKDLLPQSIRQRLLLFVNSLYDHLSSLVLTVANNDLSTSLANAVDVDEMIAIHQGFTSNLENQALISSSLTPIQHAIISVLDLCVRFADLLGERDGLKENDSKSSKSASIRQSQLSRSVVKAAQDSQIDSDEEKDEFHDARPTLSTGADSSFPDQVAEARVQFDQSLRFIVAGLRGVSRAGENGSSWEMLADKLDWKGRQTPR